MEAEGASVIGDHVLRIVLGRGRLRGGRLLRVRGCSTVNGGGWGGLGRCWREVGGLGLGLLAPGLFPIDEAPGDQDRQARRAARANPE